MAVSFILALGSSCSKELTKGLYTRVRKFPKEKPFVYNTEIKINNPKLSGEEKTVMASKLKTQMVDSLQLYIKESFVINKRLINPPVFDTSYLSASIRNMEIYLRTVGYYYSNIQIAQLKMDTVHQDNPSKQQIRTGIRFLVNTGPVVNMDSIHYLIYDSTQPQLTQALQKLTEENIKGSLLKKGKPFTEQVILNELERLVDIYRNNGYYKFSREQLYADVDSFYLPLLNPFLDPFERIQILQEAQKRKLEPVFNVFIRIRPKTDSASLYPYNIGNVTVYPDYSNAAYDSSRYNTLINEKIIIKNKTNRFKPSFITSRIKLKPGDLYRLNNANGTLDELNQLGTWQFIKIEPKEKSKPVFTPADTPKIDFNLQLVPAKKYVFSADLESVFNQVQQATIGTAGNLIGVSLTLGIRNRNLGRSGIQSSTSGKFGVERGVGSFNPGWQAVEATLNRSFNIPKLNLLKCKEKKELKQKKSFLNITASYINRNLNVNGLYKLNNFNVSYGEQFTTKKNNVWTFQPLSVEYLKLYNKSTAFQLQLDTTPFLNFSFRNGLAIGTSLSFLKSKIESKKHPNRNSYIRVNFEESGLLIGRLLQVIPAVKKEIFNYAKIDVEYKYIINKPKTVWVFRTFIGGGYNITDTASMPFFKQYTGGGPNSMRAWPLRSIGPGSRPLDQRSNVRSQFFSRSGDFIFEANIEYRYNIFTVIPNTFLVRSALFADIGNVWNFRNKSNRTNDEVVLQMKNFYRDLGVSMGSGLRFDFVSLFILRLDFAFRFKNPSSPFNQTNNGWRIPNINYKNILSGNEENKQWRYENFNFSIGINYPF